jgi:hypothetical protein
MHPLTSAAIIRAACDPTLNAAVAEYLSRKDRTAHPDGTFDRQGRWYPDDSERCACCAGIRSPSAAYPFSLLLHCRSAEHIAKKYGVDASDLRRAARALSRKKLDAVGGAP